MNNKKKKITYIISICVGIIIAIWLIAVSPLFNKKSANKIISIYTCDGKISEKYEGNYDITYGDSYITIKNSDTNNVIKIKLASGYLKVEE